jgi:hypothetical protein
MSYAQVQPVLDVHGALFGQRRVLMDRRSVTLLRGCLTQHCQQIVILARGGGRALARIERRFQVLR